MTPKSFMMMFIAMLFVVPILSIAPSHPSVAQAAPNQYEAYQEILIDYINQRRAEVGVDPIELNAQVNTAANNYAEWLYGAHLNYLQTGELYYGETETMNITVPMLIETGYEAMPRALGNDIPEEYKLYLVNAGNIRRSYDASDRDIEEIISVGQVFCDNVALRDWAVHAGIGYYMGPGLNGEQWVVYVLFVTKPAEAGNDPTPAPTETTPPTIQPTDTVEPTATTLPPTTTDVPPTVTPVPPTATLIPPTATPIPPTATSAPQLGCQKNNPDRLDCSSLQVSGTCDGSTAVFTITNTGKAGNGDMRTPTEWRIVNQAGTILDSGFIQLTGGRSMTVTYSATERITLYADQQIGHPGKSQPRATLNCGQ